MRKKTNISPLIAARMRPMRLAPSGLPAGAGLRKIARPDSPGVGHDSSPAREAVGHGPEGMLEAVSAVRASLSGLEEIHGLLRELEKSLRRAKEGRRRPPAGARALQQQVETTTAAIDAIIHRMAGNGLAPAESERAPEGSLEALLGRRAVEESCSAGPAKGQSFLSAIRAGGAQSLERASVAEVHAIVVQAVSRVHAQCRDLSAFLAERLEPAWREAEIAAENGAAARAAVRDSEFSTIAGRISGGELLLHVLNLRVEKQHEVDPRMPTFRLVTEPRAEEGDAGP